MPEVDSKRFFREQSAHSRVKAEVVAKYVIPWLHIVLAADMKSGRPAEAAYVDLFSGPGSYEDGNRSTPLLILDKVLQNKKLAQSFRAYFNDQNKAFIESLEQEIYLLPQIEQLKRRPVFTSEAASISLFESFSLRSDLPLFVFLDQFGYSNVTPNIVQRIFLHKKCDCAFFFRTSRVIAAVTNKKVVQTMDRVFGDGSLEELRYAFKARLLSKETIVLDKLKDVMLKAGAPFFMAFPFRIHESGSSKHHLIYLGKHERGFSLMKEIIGSASSRHFDGVPTMVYSDRPSGPTLFDSDLIPSLQRDLLVKFVGKELSVGRIYSMHHPHSSQFVLRNYQEALRRLEDEGKIVAFPSANKRPKRNGIVTMSESVIITFPRIVPT